MDTTKPITAVIVGGGHRSIIYADYSLSHPEELKIVGVAEPDEVRRKMVRERYSVPPENCFASAEEMAEKEKFADAVINGTMDHQHYETSVPLLKRGYAMLLEKPFAVNREEMKKLLSVIKENNNRVMICHVLRYSPFYLAIKEKIMNGELGRIINIQTAEHVGFSHLSTSYIRGKWANSDICKTSMLLAKSCHDIDIMMWLLSGTRPEYVSSFGGIFEFRPENAPVNAGTRCLADCPLVDSCDYSAKKIYLEHTYWDGYVWADFEGRDSLSEEDKIKSLKEDNPYGRCIYRCDNNVVDHQSVMISFENGATGTHNMIGGSAKSMRKIHIIGTKAEIEGALEDGCFTFRKIDLNEKKGFTEEKICIDSEYEKCHGGADEALTRDFIKFVKTGEQSVSCTSVSNSVAGHLAVFLADISRENQGKPVKFDFSEF